MLKLTYNDRITSFASFAILVLLVLGCGVQPQNPPLPPQPFNYAIWVKDKDRNALVGQATVLLVVQNTTIALKVTDDNGQANFLVQPQYLDKNAKVYVKHADFYPSEIEATLRTDSRQEVVLTSTKNPILTLPPTEPPPPSGTSQTKTTPPAYSVPETTVVVGETKSGNLAEGQTIDYVFEGNENSPVLFTARRTDENSLTFLVALYDAQGTPLKGMEVYSAEGRKMPFTPPKTGKYIMRLKGLRGFGGFLAYMENL